MKYELAKQLKDAGFPQEGKLSLEYTTDEFIKYPTLSELIEAIPKLNSIEKISNGWAAQGDGEQGYGPTPDIAVAKLWLELNKK